MALVKLAKQADEQYSNIYVVPAYLVRSNASTLEIGVKIKLQKDVKIQKLPDKEAAVVILMCQFPSIRLSDERQRPRLLARGPLLSLAPVQPSSGFYSIYFKIRKIISYFAQNTRNNSKQEL